MDFKEENLRLLKLVKGGDKKARDRVIELNLRFVNFIFTNIFENIRPQDREDFLEYGALGLIKAVDTFDIEKGASFSTYASRCIINEMLMHVRRLNKHKNVLSLDEPVKCRDNQKTTHLDKVANPEDINEIIDDFFDLKRIKTFVNCKLPEKQAKIIKIRYLSGEEKSQSEMTKETGWSQSYISRLEQKGIACLKKALAKAENQ